MQPVQDDEQLGCGVSGCLVCDWDVVKPVHMRRVLVNGQKRMYVHWLCGPATPSIVACTRRIMHPICDEDEVLIIYAGDGLLVPPDDRSWALDWRSITTRPPT